MSDVEVFAACVPGGELRPADGLYTGRLELATNGNRIHCEATARSVDQDEDEHVATILLHGRQLGGPAIGSATVQSRCHEDGSSTRVVLSAEVLASGYEHPAEAFGATARELFERAADLLQQRATNAPPPAAAPGQPPSEPVRSGAALPVPASTQRRLGLGLAVAGGALVAVVVARRFLGGRRSGLW